MVRKIAFSILLVSALVFGALCPAEAKAMTNSLNQSAALQTAAVNTGFSVSASRIELGESVVIRLNRANKKQTYAVSYYVRSSPDAKWKKIANGENKYAVKYLPKKSLNYQFKATALGQDGVKLTKTFTVAVVKDTGSPMTTAPKELPQSIALGSSIKLKNYLSGGVTPYRYSFSYSLNGGKWISLVKNSKLSYIKFTPKSAGYYTIAYYGKDSSGKLVQKQAEFVVANETGESLDCTVKASSTCELGKKLVINASASGGTAPYMYEASFTGPDTDEPEIIRSFDRSGSIKFAPEKAGKYTIIVSALDYSGQKTSAEIPVTFSGSTDEELSLTVPEYPDEFDVDTSVKFGGKASGGTLPYKYQTFMRAVGGEWEPVSENDENAECNVVLGKTGYFDVKTVVTDFSGAQAEKSVSFAVASSSDLPLENKSVILNNLITSGGELKVNAAAQGGSAPYTYEYYYRRVEANGWTKINREPKSNVCICTINTTGLFEFRVIAYDRSGNSSEKVIRYNVVKDTGKQLKSESTVSSALLGVGEIIGLEAKPSGGAEPYSYFYSSAYEDEAMTYIGSSRYNDKQYYKIPKAGKYTFRITVQDGRGKTVTKDTVVYAATDEWLDVYNPCDVMEQPLWASKCVGRVYPGTKARLIKKEGNWYQISCKGTVGWVYNMTFKSGGNYSSIDKENLPVIADDIIFTKGRDIRSLYNYVYYMSYSTDDKQPLEDLCVFMLRYRRGACYHRAALLYYLLDRAGYEAYCIDDGIDKLTGNSPHNWVIVKTEEGYRHIDATPFSFMDSFYLAKDAAVDSAFSWDRNKYPACE